MGKHQDLTDKYRETRILYKKSNNTIYTHSRTCSGTSQMCTTSGILLMKKNLSQATESHTEITKIKRDLSIETDFCILRRYCKNKRSRISNKESSAKSKYSAIVDPEIDTIEEIPPDIIASGDSKAENKLAPIDVATIMLENLKNLLSRWIERHLSENKDAKEKVGTILDLILHRIELNTTQRASLASTYVVDKKAGNYKMKNKKVETNSDICQYCKRKSHPVIINLSKHMINKHMSSYSVPFLVKGAKLISTLSIPKKKKHNISWYKVKKIKHKNILLSINNSSSELDSSSFNLLAISTTFLNNRSSTQNFRKHIKEFIELYPKPSISSIPNLKTKVKEETMPLQNEFLKRDNLENIPSLVKGIYADTTINDINSDYNIDEPDKTVKDTFTLTDIHNLKYVMNDLNVNTSKSNVNYDQSNYRTGSQITILTEDKQTEPVNNMTHQNISSHKDDVKGNVNNYRKEIKFNIKRKKLSNLYRLRKMENKHAIFVYKSGKYSSQSKDALKNLQNILQYFVDYKDNRNIKFDIQLKILPIVEPENMIEKKDIHTNISNEEVNVNENTYNCKIILDSQPNINTFQDGQAMRAYNNDRSLEYNSKIIPILDGAVSQARYFDIEKLSEEKIIITDQTSIKSKSRTFDQIHKSNSVTNEVSEKTESKNWEYGNAKRIEDTKYQLQRISKGVQISNDFTKNVLLTGLKLSKEPKKDALDIYSRLMKKGTSYDIIDSESILKVTDMSVVNEVNYQKVVDEGLTCSLPKSRSLFEVITENNKKKVVAYYCDKCYSKDSYGSYNKSKLPCHKCSLIHVSSDECENCPECPPSESNHNFPECSSTIYIVNNDEVKGCVSKKIICSKRKGMGFGEGFVYCVLLWIPIIIIACLFYSYVIKDLINPKPRRKIHRLRMDSDRKTNVNESVTFDLKLSDLGF